MNTLKTMPEPTIDAISFLKIENQKLIEKINYLEEQLAWFQKKIFGKRSEKIIQPHEEQLLIAGIEDLSKNEPVKTTIVPEHSRKEYKKASTQISFPDNLP